MNANIDMALNKGPIIDLALLLLEARNTSHILHLKTRSYAQHMALNDFYEGILDIFDKIVETYQGKYGIISGYGKSIRIDENAVPVKYIESVLNELESLRKEFKDGWIQQIIDDAIELTTSTLYKLKFLS